MEREIILITGPAGSGKTSMAMKIAKERFPNEKILQVNICHLDYLDRFPPAIIIDEVTSWSEVDPFLDRESGKLVIITSQFIAASETRRKMQTCEMPGGLWGYNRRAYSDV